MRTSPSPTTRSTLSSWPRPRSSTSLETGRGAWPFTPTTATKANFWPRCRWRYYRPRPNCSKPWSAGAFAASTKWRRFRRSASGNGAARRDCACASSPAAKAIASCFPSPRRSISKTRSSWIIRWNCWSRSPSSWPASSDRKSTRLKSRHSVLVVCRLNGDRMLLPPAGALHFEDEIELDYPVELLEPLAFLLARLINGLSTRLATRGLATDELRLRLKLEIGGIHERCLRLPAPSLDTKAFLKLLQLDLEANPPAGPIVHLWMGVNPVKPQAAQCGLFVPVAPDPVKLELTLARIQALVREGRVGTPELLDTHRPDAFRIQKGAATPSQPRFQSASVPSMALRIFRPRRAARV